MGASGWHYVVPYREDVAAALQDLRQATYDTGAYYQEDPDPTLAMTESEFVAQLEPADEDSGINEFNLKEWRAAQRRPTPVDPDTLLRSQPDSGTHSIIDMYRGLSDWPAPFTVSPLTPEQAEEIFGTETPSDEQIIEWVGYTEEYGGRARWEGVYLISYAADGIPQNLHFAGRSGD